MAEVSPAEAGSAVTFLYEDADLVVVDKPPGVTVVPALENPVAACLRDRVAAALGARVWPVHRLDRDTSGVVAFARTAEAHRALSMAFEARRVHKRYRALVAGVPVPASGSIDLALHEARRGKARPARPGEPGAKAASTSYVVTRHWSGDGTVAVSWVDVTPHTGRHHQIRVHLRAVGTPVLGDATYGRSAAVALEVPRLALHATTLDVPHPARPDRRVVATSPWPDDLAALTRWLDSHWTASS